MKTYTLAQIQAAFAASCWSEFNQQTEDDAKTGAGAYYRGHSAFYIDGNRISCSSELHHRDAEYLTKKAKDKNKKLEDLYHFTGGNTNRKAAKEALSKQSHIDALEARLFDALERIDSMQVGDGSTSHDQAFDNREVVA
jgi:hypothetical protein